MIDPNHVLIRCPQGHELQAARDDLDKELACPICNTTFLAREKPASTPDAPATSAATSVDRAAGVDYAPVEEIRNVSRVKYPAYTTWLLGLWVAVLVWVTIKIILKTLNPAMADAESLRQSSLPVFMLVGIVDCSAILCLPVVLVLQLMWIFRIHKDARRYGHYDTIEPMLALILSFIPFLNVPWTAFAMLRLAVFSAQGDRAKNTEAASAVHAAKACLVTGLLVAVSFGFIFMLAIVSGYQAHSIALQQGIAPNSPEMHQRIAEAAALSPVFAIALQLICTASVVTYVFAVRRLEASLYERLGAIPR